MYFFQLSISYGIYIRENFCKITTELKAGPRAKHVKTHIKWTHDKAYFIIAALRPTNSGRIYK